MFNSDLEAIEKRRRAEDLAREKELTPEERSRKAANLIMVTKLMLTSIPEVSAAICEAYYSTKRDKADLEKKGQVTFRRGDHVWELVSRFESGDVASTEELTLTKLPPIEVKDPADLQEAIRVLFTYKLGVVEDAAIQYNHLFADGKNPIIHTNTNLSVEYALRFINDFRVCDRRSV